MNKTYLRVVLALLPTAALLPANGSEPSVDEMREKCGEAREQKIAPLREAAIEECVSSRRSSRTREDCERLYQDFGQGGGTVSGGFRPPMFNDLPECVDYHSAINAQTRSGSRR